MSDLDPKARSRLDALVHQERVVLFMKGSRTAPRCGFSARTVAHLDALIDDYATVDVLADALVREGMKDYANWPTFPQLWVDGDLIGGADIIDDLAAQGELATLLGARTPEPPAITVTDAARDRIIEVLEGESGPLRLRIDARFDYAFDIADPEPGDQQVVANGITLVFDPASARRGDGLRLDYAQGPQGAALVIDNPNEPAKVQPLSVQQLDAWRQQGVEHVLIDVRTPQEWAICRIDGARLGVQEGIESFYALPKPTRLVFQCHHGVRSQQAAEHFLDQGFTQVFNLSGGIDAWSAQIDPDVPRY